MLLAQEFVQEVSIALKYKININFFLRFFWLILIIKRYLWCKKVSHIESCAWQNLYMANNVYISRCSRSST